jgi:hypothetical protein
MSEHAIANAEAWLSNIREMLAAIVPGEDSTPAEYQILLSTGGPALRIVGELSKHGEPEGEPVLQWQDWGTPWTTYPLDEAEREAVGHYAAQFYYREG